MSLDEVRFTTKELSEATWPDFERFFSEVGAGGGCGCMLTPRGGVPFPPVGRTAKDRAEQLGAPNRSRKEFPRRDLRLAQNLGNHRELVWQGRARGILVYAAGEPVGWCQYGRVSDLPLARTPKTPERLLARDPTSQWRVTCFLTRRKFRRQGVASAALAAAVEGVRNGGGGWIEATPIAMVHHDPLLGKLRKTYGWRSQEIEDHLKSYPMRLIPGIGSVQAHPGCHHQDTMSMFERLASDLQAWLACCRCW